ncbi:hypothetical protein F8178_17590 [Haloechinothrix sp. LS1_15]|nr:hypothetical protein [Haloechinothrix sp. LS1_15]
MHGEADGDHSGMTRMCEQMMEDNPGMEGMHEEMMRDNPGMEGMHERMMGGAHGGPMGQDR